ncbi:MAG: hypothetical protein DWI00_00090 [Planctomycetota bacterium]|nr:MAG: hypothetical protein DWI00_00090 [Planctomycetota bacterium]
MLLLVTTDVANRGSLRYSGPTPRGDIDLICKVSGTASTGAVKLTAGTSSLSLEVIAKSA